MTCHTVTSRNRHETDSEEEMGCNNSKPVDGRKSSQMQRYQAVFDDLGINEVSALLMCAHMLRMRIGTRAPERLRRPRRAPSLSDVSFIGLVRNY